MRALLLALLLAAGCSPLRAQVVRAESVAPPTPECSSARRKVRVWGGVRVGALSLTGASGLAQLTPLADDKGAQVGLAVGALLAVGLGEVASYLADSYAVEAGEECQLQPLPARQ